MRLSTARVRSIGAPANVSVPHEQLFALPERVIQFGTGRFLRGFADSIIHRANADGRFGGRIVAVQSTGRRRADVLNGQDGLFTLCEQGLDGEKAVEEYTIVSSISRVISAADDWVDVLACAANPDVSVMLSNTTEAGLQLDDEDRFAGDPPASFPAKVTRFLYERYQTFEGSADAGMVILPCELVEENGRLLKSLVLETARKWELEDEFLNWISTSNIFCDSLVDRIVTGYPDEDEVARHREKLPYEDALLTCTEQYHFWAIQGDGTVADRLPFADASDNVLVTDNIDPYFERKIRILNGGHTLMSPVSFLCGHDTVHEALMDDETGRFIRELLSLEIAPTLPPEVEGVDQFVQDVLIRWSNPFLNHALLDITSQTTLKLRMRVLPTVRRHYERNEGTSPVPERIAFGIAGYFAFVRYHLDGGAPSGGGGPARSFEINDDLLSIYQRLWKTHAHDPSALVKESLSTLELWETDLTDFPGFEGAVVRHLTAILDRGARAALADVLESTSQRNASR